MPIAGVGRSVGRDPCTVSVAAEEEQRARMGVHSVTAVCVDVGDAESLSTSDLQRCRRAGLM